MQNNPEDPPTAGPSGNPRDENDIQQPATKSVHNPMVDSPTAVSDLFKQRPLRPTIPSLRDKGLDKVEVEKNASSSGSNLGPVSAPYDNDAAIAPPPPYLEPPATYTYSPFEWSRSDTPQEQASTSGLSVPPAWIDAYSFVHMPHSLVTDGDENHRPFGPYWRRDDDYWRIALGSLWQESTSAYFDRRVRYKVIALPEEYSGWRMTYGIVQPRLFGHPSRKVFGSPLAAFCHFKWQIDGGQAICGCGLCRI
ncbi:hypothetical protein Slin15195_G062280 [Septoria linicola]|uniref:Cryptic loci regulator 2 N-terminal domain-containing protein n=1 Tax=Septoria linicola TaxID=215465 RepID=A0A9Q9AP75_9PEZI|nr:hypothetical protein Slin14017_G078090 [Septoria linicola]USW52909.1 hypothetical protein Slin15195_G062280 [Septoria linicola]